MLVSHRKKFIYMKTRKTAGTSIEEYFVKYCYPENVDVPVIHKRGAYVSNTGIIGRRGHLESGKRPYWHGHMIAKEVKRKLYNKYNNNMVWNTYFKFAVIRNPFDRIVSHFYWKNRDKKLHLQPNEDVIFLFRKTVGRHCKNVIADRKVYSLNDIICVNFFIRYEYLFNDLKYICSYLDVPFEPNNLPKLKVGLRDNCLSLSHLYDEKSINVVKRYFNFELRYFKYTEPVL